jgi:hypothetical protein
MKHSNASGIDIHNIHNRRNRLNVETQTYPMDGYNYMGHSNMGHSNMGHSNMGHSNFAHRNWRADGYNYLSADETGIAPVDEVITKTLDVEKKYLDRPLIQFAILGLAVFGGVTLVNKFM